MKKLKAYEVQDNYEGHAVIVFSTSNAAARREGASELNTEWESISSCRRAPGYDSYSPGPVPPMILIEDGWWFECFNCSRKVSNGMHDQLDDEGLDPEDFTPEPFGKTEIFCSAQCATDHWLRKRRRGAAMAALIEVFEAKFPGAKALRYHVCDDKLDEQCSVVFTVPGIQGNVDWRFGSPDVLVQQRDVDAYKEWQQIFSKLSK